MLEFVARLDAESNCVRVVEMGRSAEGRSMPMMILADPMVADAAEARRTGRMVVYAQGGIHSGECCGKEALQMLARDIARQPEHPLLQELVILISPIYNPDGNERVAVDNRPGQAGPIHGMGQRATAEGYDLNRDNTKLDTPEAQALSRVLNEWDPLLVIDTHTTNGSYHQNTLTFDGPVNPAGDRAIIDFVREVYLPSVSESVERETGYQTTFYGNYNRDKTRWTTYEGRPRFGTRARGIRGIVSILTEAYKYASYKDRVLCTKAFCEHLFNYAASHRSRFENLVSDVRRRTVSLGQHPSAHNRVALRAKVARIPRDIQIHGWVEEVPEGAQSRRARAVPTDVKHTYTMEHWGAYEATHSVQRPVAYAYSSKLTSLTEKLRQHGIVATAARGVGVKQVEVYRIDALNRSSRSYQNHHQLRPDVTVSAERREIGDDMMIISTSHPLGNLIVYLLEPEAEDCLAAWNVLDSALKAGEEYPVIRIMK